MKDSKPKLKSSKAKSKRTKPLPRHEEVWYGILHRGKVVGGIDNPDLFTLEGAKEWVQDVPRNTKVVKIRVTYEVIAEVIV